MKQNGTDKQQVTHLSGAAIFPDFSPDGSKIVFAAKPAGATDAQHLRRPQRRRRADNS